MTFEQACERVAKGQIRIIQAFDLDDMWVFDVCGSNGETLTIGHMPAVIKATGEATSVFPPKIMKRLDTAPRLAAPDCFKPSRMPPED